MSSPSSSSPSSSPSSSSSQAANSRRELREAQLEDVEILTKIVNWAYRGKPIEQNNTTTTATTTSTPSTTTESTATPSAPSPSTHLISWAGDGHAIAGARITVHQMIETIEQTKDRTANHQIRVFVIEQITDTGRQILGCVKAEHKLDQDYAEFGLLAVDPHQQSGGCGTTLLYHAHNYAMNEWNIKYGRMYVVNHAKGLYEWYTGRVGYAETGVREPFPTHLINERLLLPNVCFIELQQELAIVCERLKPKPTTQA